MGRPNILTHLIGPITLLIVLTWVIERYGLDQIFSDQFYDFGKSSWPMRTNWWIEQLIHRTGRGLVVTMGFGAIAVALGSWRVDSLRRFRRAALYLVFAIGISTGLVTLAKTYSVRPCPWDVDRYGGTSAAGPLFAANTSGICPGNCFPSSHASVGYSLLAGYFLFKDRRPALGRSALVFALLIGTVFSIAQVARGAHFLSHGIWSAAICWYVCLGLYQIGFRRRVHTDEASPSVRLTQPRSSHLPEWQTAPSCSIDRGIRQGENPGDRGTLRKGISHRVDETGEQSQIHHI